MRKIINQAYLLLVKQKLWDKINAPDPINLIQEHSIIIISSTSISVSDSFLIIFQTILLITQEDLIKHQKLRGLFQSMSEMLVPMYSQYCFIKKIRASLLL